MNTIIKSTHEDHPTLSPLTSGKALKVFEVSGKTGMVMPQHHSTLEAVVTIKSGKANLIFKDSEFLLQTGTSFLIPAGKSHVLEILEDLQAVVVMLVDSELKFDVSN